MKKVISIIMAIMICMAMFTGGAHAEKKVINIPVWKGISYVAFDTEADCKWYVENVWRNDEVSDEEKDSIYFEMTGGTIYVNEEEV